MDVSGVNMDKLTSDKLKYATMGWPVGEEYAD